MASAEEIEYIEAGGAREIEREGEDEPPAEAVRWRDLFRYRTIWGMMLGFFCLNFDIYFFITWFPSYLVNAREFDLLQLGFYGTIPALVAIPGGWIGGLVSDSLVRRGVNLTVARKVCLVGGMLFSSVIALAVPCPRQPWPWHCSQCVTGASPSRRRACGRCRRTSRPHLGR
jgi:ACS family D-galactonate transporter-like MFS transporter